MGHVSDFNGMNTCDETDFSQATSDLLPPDNILDSLNENFLPIYNSFPDDIYRHPNLYASNNLTSFINTDEDRNGYFDDSLNLDLLFDSASLSFDFDSSVPLLENETPVTQNDPVRDFNIGSDASESFVQVKQEPEASENFVQVKQEPEVLESHTNKTVSHNDVGQEIHFDGNFDTSESKTYMAETVFKNSESSDEKEEIPKIIIRLKAEPKDTEDFSTAEASLPMTIADSVKLGRRRNGNLKSDDSGEIVKKSSNKHKSRKRKSRHKKRRDVVEAKSKKTPDINQNFNAKPPNSKAASVVSENLFLNQNTCVNTKSEDTCAVSNCSAEFKNGIDTESQVTNNTIICFKKSSPSAGRDNYYSTDDELDSSDDSPVNRETVDKTESKLLVEAGDSFQFDFENANSVSLPSPVEANTQMEDASEDFLEIHISSDCGNIPDLNESLLDEIESTKTVESSANSSLSSEIEKEEFLPSIEAENSVLNSEPNKSSSASDLIEELNAHNQQVFEEIEISTPELELELSSSKNSTNSCLEASHHSENSANEKTIVQNQTTPEPSESITNSQYHSSHSKISAQNVSVFHSTTYNNHGGAARSRTISSSSCSVTGKSSTSHRSYRKRRRSSSSSSSSSEREKFYNRPVKYDPVTQTYCDEFGREIRPNELKYYLDAKSRPRDCHSNNGSSSSSRSKSPRYRSHHRKHHKSRSGSRSHKRQRYSSSRSRSRSRGRKYKVDIDKRYRSPSPKHRSKRHYLDVEENMRAYEERRVMYVGDIPPEYTVEQLKDRFGRFGPIQAASIKSKITVDGSLYIFGFVTFKNRSDVCQAIERGNENPSWPRFDLNFGGRRRFCNGNYTDLDGKVAEAESGWYGHHNPYRQPQPPRQEDDFAELLRQEQRRLGMSKK